MQRQAVSSSMLRSVGYDAATQTLEVEFLNGSVYQYFAVPATTYHNLLAADSLGSYFQANIRGAFSYQKLAKKRS